MPIAAAKAHIRALIRQATEAHILPHDRPASVITALSGGPDSLALCLVMQQIADENALSHQAIIIDHGLRAESAQEAGFVADQVKKRGVDARIIRLTAAPPKAGIQHWARSRRLSSLADAGIQKGALILFAHHRDDQAETVAMRLLKNSAVRGLSGISKLRFYQGALFGRPFLSMEKSQLKAICAQFGVVYIDDPSNQDARFTRVNIRRELDKAPDLRSSLNQLGQLCGRLASTLDRGVDNWVSAHGQHFCRLQLKFPAAAFFGESPAAQMMLLGYMIRYCGATEYGPDDASLLRACSRLSAGQPSTLSSCHIYHDRGWICGIREYGRKPPPALLLLPHHVGFYDRCWYVCASEKGQVRRFLEVRDKLKEQQQLLPKPYIDMPFRLRALIPVLQTLDDRYVLPHLRCSEQILHQTDNYGKDKRRSEFTIWPAPTDGQVVRPF